MKNSRGAKIDTVNLFDRCKLRLLVKVMNKVQMQGWDGGWNRDVNIRKGGTSKFQGDVDCSLKGMRSEFSQIKRRAPAPQDGEEDERQR